jgi:DNA-binding CsgD family transcriptional regulator
LASMNASAVGAIVRRRTRQARSSSMSTLAQPASSQVGLLRDRSQEDRPPDAALFEYFVTARRRARGPMLVVNSSRMVRNPAAAAVVEPDDHLALWAWASHAIRAGDRSVHALQLRDVSFSAQCQEIAAGADVIGALVRLGTHAPTSSETSLRPTRRRLGWESLRESELGIAQHVAAGMTNREIGACLFLSRHTVDFHLRQIFRKLSINSRVALTRIVVERGRMSAFAAPGA